MSKLLQLQDLKDEIQAKIVDAWVFPENGEVKGFLGTADLMFVGERPSTGSFGGVADIFLYELLEKYDAANAHLTDVIKGRGLVKAPYPDMKVHRQIFDKELEIIKPRRVIAFGQKVHDLLRFSLAPTGIEIVPIWHYSCTRYPYRREPFEEQIIAALT